MMVRISTKQKLEIVGRVAHYFDSEVHLITPKETEIENNKRSRSAKLRIAQLKF